MAFKMKGPSLLKMTSALKQKHVHPGRKGAHATTEEHDPPLHQQIVGGRGNKQPKKGLAKFLEKINPFDAESRSRRRNKKSRKNIARINTWRK